MRPFFSLLRVTSSSSFSSTPLLPRLPHSPPSSPRFFFPQHNKLFSPPSSSSPSLLLPLRQFFRSSPSNFSQEIMADEVAAAQKAAKEYQSSDKDGKVFCFFCFFVFLFFCFFVFLFFWFMSFFLFLFLNLFLSSSSPTPNKKKTPKKRALPPSLTNFSPKNGTLTLSMKTKNSLLFVIFLLRLLLIFLLFLKKEMDLHSFRMLEKTRGNIFLFSFFFVLFLLSPFFSLFFFYYSNLITK